VTQVNANAQDLPAGPLLITGGSGLLGAACVDVALALGHTVVATHHRQQPHRVHARLRWVGLDLTGDDAERVMAGVAPRAVVHAAALAVPLDVERDPVAGHAVNVVLPGRLARAAAAGGARFVHVSTDLVFDGARGDYREEDAVNPISRYGHTKAEAEERVATANANHVVARTSLLLGPSVRGDRGVEEALFNAVSRGESPRLFVDEYRTPVAAACLARLLLALVDHPWRGVLHTTGAQVVSRHGLGLLVARSLGLPPERLVPVRLADTPPTVPPRAPNTTLNTTRLRQLAPSLPQPLTLEAHLRGHPRAVSLQED